MMGARSNLLLRTRRAVRDVVVSPPLGLVPTTVLVSIALFPSTVLLGSPSWSDQTRLEFQAKGVPSPSTDNPDAMTRHFLRRKKNWNKLVAIKRHYCCSAALVGGVELLTRTKRGELSVAGMLSHSPSHDARTTKHSRLFTARRLHPFRSKYARASAPP